MERDLDVEKHKQLICTMVDRKLALCEDDLRILIGLVSVINQHCPGTGRRYARYIWNRFRKQWRITVAAGSWAETVRLAWAGAVALWSVAALTLWSITTPAKIWHLNRVVSFLQR